MLGVAGLARPAAGVAAHDAVRRRRLDHVEERRARRHVGEGVGAGGRRRDDRLAEAEHDDLHLLGARRVVVRAERAVAVAADDPGTGQVLDGLVEVVTWVHVAKAQPAGCRARRDTRRLLVALRGVRHARAGGDPAHHEQGAVRDATGRRSGALGQGRPRLPAPAAKVQADRTGELSGARDPAGQDPVVAQDAAHRHVARRRQRRDRDRWSTCCSPGHNSP